MTLRYRIELTPGDSRELVAARLWVGGAIGVQELPDAMIAWFDHRVEDVPPGGSWDTEPQRDWLATWREDIRTVRAGHVSIVPSWLFHEHEPRPDEVTILLDPGVAFGSGHHATTQLCLEALQRHLLEGAAVLDVGCGTGVLAIAAAKLGAERVVAVDVDADAVAATALNAGANGVDVVAATGSVDAAEGTFDVVLANLLTPTLHALATRLLRTTTPGGVVVASGVASERAAMVGASLVAAGGEIVERQDRDGWAALVVRRPVAPGEQVVA